MTRNSICIKVPKQHAEQALAMAHKLNLLNKGLQINRDENFVYIPLCHKPTKTELEKTKELSSAIELSTRLFLEKKKNISYTELLEKKLPPHLLASLPRAMDIICDICIVEIPPELDAYRQEIGTVILKTNRNVRTVLAKASAVTGMYRLRKFAVIAGEPKTETVHKEYTCKFHVDVSKAYFSPRLSAEHSRIAHLVKEGETVLDMFAGIGPFAVQIAKKHENVKVYAVDANPDAVEFLKRNARLNRVEEKITVFLGDSRKVIKEKLVGVADRVIMNLPEKSLEYVDVACQALRSAGGVIHFYSFIKRGNTLRDAEVCLAETVAYAGRKVEKVLFSRFVRETAPHQWQAVTDAKIV
ncbi:MAG: class I SAM-dependent methyltransferase family protein [Candidatus Bathyarchaeota archaeon]|nr:class I SAM-dependent methyltransferase family protein [Candidatus Bathyarchaeota archaeon]